MRSRPLRALLSIAVLGAAFVALPPLSGAASPTPGPVRASERHVGLRPPLARSGDPAGTLAAGERRAAGSYFAATARASSRLSVLQLSEPTDVGSEVAVVGVTWSRGTAPMAVAQYRTRSLAGWSAWQSVETDAGAVGDADAGEDAGRAGSAPIPLVGAKQVQVRVIGPAGGVPARADLAIIDPGASPADSAAGAARPGSAAAVAGRPTILTRAQWGADESLRTSGPAYGAVKGFVVHHTAGSNAYTPAQVPALLRGIYTYHVKGRGWSDVGYQFLVDKFGRVWEGRHGGIDQAVVGAQTANFNYYTMGISIMGNYSEAKPTTAGLDAIARVIAWKAGLHELSPTGATNLYGKTYPTVLGHRDVGQTGCPGDYLYPLLGWIRARAAAYAGYTPALTLRRDAKHDMGSDVLARAVGGTLVTSSATGRGDLSTPSLLSSADWSGYDVTMLGDWDGDGDVDVMARQSSTGALVLARSNGRGVLSVPTPVGRGWGGMRLIVSRGDWNGDGRPDILAANAAGQLFQYLGNGTGGLRAGGQVGQGWSGIEKLVAVGDWDADRRVDVMGVAAGAARLYRGGGAGRFAGTQTLSGDWSRFATVVGVSDTDRDGRTEVLGVDADGVGWLGRRVGAADLTWSRAAPSFAGLAVYGG